MSLRLDIGCHGPAIIALVSQDGDWEAAAFDRVDAPDPTDAIHLVRPMRRLTKIDATIVDLGDGREGVVRRPPSQTNPFLAQVSKPGRPGKRMELNARPILAGRTLIRQLAGGRLTVSYRLKQAKAARARAADLGLGEGWTLRHAFMNADEAAIAAEAEALTATAETIAAARDVGLVHPPPPIWRRLLDHYDPIARMTADPAVSLPLPEGAERGAVDLTDFVAHNSRAQAPLGQGGSLWIEATRALTAIDVDAGGDRPAAANAAAPHAVARALRLRNIAGTIVVDLINRPGGWDKDLAAWRTALAADWLEVTPPARVSPLGLIELARPRRGYSLAEAIAPSFDQSMHGKA
jgi:hypothetical protein